MLGGVIGPEGPLSPMLLAGPKAEWSWLVRERRDGNLGAVRRSALSFASLSQNQGQVGVAGWWNPAPRAWPRATPTWVTPPTPQATQQPIP
jgi:hypothetical protein